MTITKLLACALTVGFLFGCDKKEPEHKTEPPVVNPAPVPAPVEPAPSAPAPATPEAVQDAATDAQEGAETPAAKPGTAQ